MRSVEGVVPGTKSERSDLPDKSAVREYLSLKFPTYPIGMRTVLLLIGSNIFMTFAWYGHLKYKQVALWKVILVSWSIAFFEYCLQVPANRIGARTFSPDQLKVIQEIITLTVFGVFSVFYFGDRLHWNHFVAFTCLVAGAFFMFHRF